MGGRREKKRAESFGFFFVLFFFNFQVNMSLAVEDNCKILFLLFNVFSLKKEKPYIMYH